MNMKPKPKLSPEDISKAYQMYTTSPQQPTLAYLAHLFNVSTNTMFLAINKEKERRNTDPRQLT